MKLLIAEDEVGVARALQTILQRNRFSVDVTYDGEEALHALLSNHYDLAILDIMMPKLDGIEVLRQVRAHHLDLPILLLTAKAEVEDRVEGLNAGADDYLPKPFATSELIARVKALMRRSSSYVSDTLTLGNTQLDCNRFEIFTPTKHVRLNNKEFQMLELFFRNPHHVFSVQQLTEQIWRTDVEINVVWAYIAFSRKKLKEIQSNVEIQTVRGAGYSLEEISC